MMLGGRDSGPEVPARAAFGLDPRLRLAWVERLLRRELRVRLRRRHGLWPTDPPTDEFLIDHAAVMAWRAEACRPALQRVGADACSGSERRP